MNVATSTAAWPSAVWDARWLRMLDGRGRSEIEAAGRLRILGEGEILFRAGDPADTLCVVVGGRLALRDVRDVRQGKAQAIRLPSEGDVFGEEAFSGVAAERSFEARCDTRATVAEIPVVVLRRALVRAGGAESLMKVERTLRRATALDLLRSAPLTRALADEVIEALLDACRFVALERSEHVYREGDDGGDAYLVHSGMVQVQSADRGRPRIEAYLARGDVFGEGELDPGAKRDLSVVASGPSAVLAIPGSILRPIARRHPELLERAQRIRGPSTLPAGATRVLDDVYRLHEARSLLVIRQDTCTRCGHCAWSCAAVHEDGVSRLVRHGATGHIALSRRDEAVADVADVAPLLVPNSCQHCQNPSCMAGCPTGAIGRDAKGDVFITEDLCTGCGNCVRACPWDNIQLAARPAGASYPAVAVKCDLCGDRAEGPACVAACPAEAIARIEPNAISPAATVIPRTVPAWPFVVGAAFGSVGAALLPLGRWPTGLVSGVIVGLLVVHAAFKRAGLRSAVRGRVDALLARMSRGIATSRAFYIGHLTLGVLGLGAVVGHVGGHARGSGGPLAVAIAVALFTGGFGAAMSAILPRALSRLERKSVLPEEIAGELRRLEETMFAALSGKSEVVKTLFRTALLPYHRSAFGFFALVLRRRDLRTEERHVRMRIDRLAEGRLGVTTGIDELVRLVVEHRALRAQRVLLVLLRGWLVPHVAASAVVVVLLALHVIAVSVPRSMGAPRSTATSERR